MKKITIIGAGKIGTTIANMLAGNIWPRTNNSYEITIADQYGGAFDQKSLNFLKQNNKRHLVTSNHEELKNLLLDQDYVINAGPYFISTDVAQVASEIGVNYFDLTEDVEQTNNILKISDNCKNNQIFMPQCGLAPGFISVITNYLAKQFDVVYDIKMRVGALPKNINNHLKYNMTWSVDGLVNEYLQPCVAIKNKKLVKTEPLSDYEILNIDGNEYEAFNTSGGLGSMCETWANKVHNMNYKSIRYVGHHNLIKFLIEDLKLYKNNGQQLKELLKQSIPTTNQDVIVIFVSINGLKDRQFVEDTWTKKIYGQNKYSAIQLATAAGVSSMIHLHQTNDLPKCGLVKQEQVDFLNFINTPYARNVYN